MSSELPPPILGPQPFDDPIARPPVSRAWIARFGLLYLGQNLAWAAPTQILIATQVAHWYPHSKERHLAWIMALGGVMTLIATPLAGLISDRTSGRFGRRKPWIVIGAVGAAAMLTVMSRAGNYYLLAAAWMVFHGCLSFTINAAQSVAPDRVPTRQYGTVSGVMGLTYTLAIVLGTAVAALFPVPIAYVVSAGLLLLLVAQFAATFHDPQVRRMKPQGPDGPVITPEQRHDFIWVFITRLLVTLANGIALFYLFYYLRDRIKVAHPAQSLLLLTVVYAVCVFISAIISGIWSDRVGRRKPFVALASLGASIAGVLMAGITSFAPIIGAAIILGLSWGVYIAVDQALINEVLPSVHDRARDMGIMNIAVAIPNATSPVVAAVALTWLGGYPGVYLLATVLAIAGGLLIRQVRGVR